MVGCGTPPKDDICEEDVLHTLGGSELWDSCPVEIQDWIRVVDGHCYYDDVCGKEWRIAGCFLSDGTMCPTSEPAPRSLIGAKKLDNP